MILKYCYGNPLETEAVIEKIRLTESVPAGDGVLPESGLDCLKMKEGGCVFTCSLSENDIVYGLGQQIRGINKRGWVYESWCSDDPDHTENKRSLYGVHNFLIIDGKECFGIFVDTPQRVRFDIGYTDGDILDVSMAANDYYLYLIKGDDPENIVKEFRRITGKSYIPPKWAFGYGQSRWSYMDEEEVREVVRRHRENNIPLDSVYLDIDYMERYKDFTVNEETFPDFAGFAEEMREQGIHLVPIIDAGVKIEEGYDIYEEGSEKGYFCRKEDGTYFTAGVWPGRVHFPDMLNDEAREWFGSKYKFLLDQGIEGFWNDMNEPAIFYSEDHLNEVFEQLEEYKDKNLDVNTFFEFQDLVRSIANNPEDYRSFYHQYKGEKIRHDKVHNLFGYYMTRAAGEAFERLMPEKRILMFSRSSYIGMHRYGGIWMGDNHSWWSHLLLNIHMLPSLNMCGFLYTGADLGGFGSDATEDLLMRWLELGIFTPLMRNHSASGTRRQEAYQFKKLESFAGIIGLRYGLLPYLYSEYMKAAIKDEMFFRPLSFVYRDDSQAKLVEDQLLVGESIMIAPVYEQNAQGRCVYLPEDMKMYRMRSLEDMDTEIMEKGYHYIQAKLDEVLMFIRPDHLVPVSSGGRCVEEVDENRLRVLGYIKDGAEYELYQDNGYEKDYNIQRHTSAIIMTPGGQLEETSCWKQMPDGMIVKEIE